MGETKNYIRWIRGKVGHDKVILAFAGGYIRNEKDEILLQRRRAVLRQGRNAGTAVFFDG